MNWILVSLLAMGLLVNSCATTTQETTSSKFVGMCQAIGLQHGGKITKADLMAAAKNKEEADTLAALYDLCDVERKGYVTSDELARSNRLQQVIRLTTPGR